MPKKKDDNEQWRKHARDMVAAVLRDAAHQEEETIRIALMDAYPFDKKKTFKLFLIWLNEISRQRRNIGKKPIESKNQGQLF